MIEPNQLLQTYIRQYQAASKKKRKTSSRPRDLSERTNRLFKTLKRTKPTQVTSLSLEEWHRQIKNLAYFAYRSHNDAVTKLIETSLLPQLIRLDEAMFLPAQRDDISVDFLNYLETELDGQLCTQTLLELYQIYKRYVIQYKIMDLVPSRPELEFPETMAMNRRFILHIGPTNSGKTFHALERLKTAKKGTYLGPLRLLALEVYEKMHDYGVPSTMLTGQECIADDDSRITASTIEMADFSEEYDIAVIDEAQLTADPDRGHCWTKAILGLKAHEIHVCMSPAAESAVTHLIHLCGDSLPYAGISAKLRSSVRTRHFPSRKVFFPAMHSSYFPKNLCWMWRAVWKKKVSRQVLYTEACRRRSAAARCSFYQRQNQGGRRHRRDRHGTQPACPAYRICPDPEI